VAYERDLHGFAGTLAAGETWSADLQSLALVRRSHTRGTERFDDPARFSFALGGKTGIPFQVPLKTYDESLDFLRTTLDRPGQQTRAVAIKCCGKEKLDGLRRSNGLCARSRRGVKPERTLARHQARAAISASLDGLRCLLTSARGRRGDNRRQARRPLDAESSQRSLF